MHSNGNFTKKTSAGKHDTSAQNLDELLALQIAHALVEPLPEAAQEGVAPWMRVKRGHGDTCVCVCVGGG